MYANLQLGSRLFSAPLEIREAIYEYLVPDGVHVYLHRDNLRLSRCVQPHLGDDLWGGERQEADSPYSGAATFSDPVWARRLRSSWGPHWKCEEKMLGTHRSRQTVHDVDISSLYACKRA